VTHTPPPLKIGCKNRNGYAKPSVFWREIGEPVEVEVESDCYVKFDDHHFFNVDGSYTAGDTPTWKPLANENGTAGFNVTCSKPRPVQSEGTRSIKIGSGRRPRVRKTKVKSKKAKAKKRTK